MESWWIAVIIADAIGFIASVLLLAIRWNKEWAKEQAKWTFVIIIIWVVILVTEFLISRG